MSGGAITVASVTMPMQPQSGGTVREPVVDLVLFSIILAILLGLYAAMVLIRRRLGIHP